MPYGIELNGLVQKADPRIHGRYAYAHPLFDGASFNAQSQLHRIQGRGGVWYAGAWTGFGFHEDGLRSGLNVARALGSRPVWSRTEAEPLADVFVEAAE